MAISNTLLTTGNAQVIYTSSGSTVVSLMYFNNQNASAQTINVYAVPSGGTVGGNTQIYSSLQLASKDTYVTDWEKLVLANGDALYANASANVSVVATVSYIGI